VAVVNAREQHEYRVQLTCEVLWAAVTASIAAMAYQAHLIWMLVWLWLCLMITIFALNSRRPMSIGHSVPVPEPASSDPFPGE